MPRCITCSVRAFLTRYGPIRRRSCCLLVPLYSAPAAARISAVPEGNGSAIMAGVALRGFDGDRHALRCCSVRHSPTMLLPARTGEFDGSTAVWWSFSRTSSSSPGWCHPRGGTGHQATIGDADSPVPHRCQQLARSPRNGDLCEPPDRGLGSLVWRRRLGLPCFLVHTRPMIAAILEAPWQALPAAQQNFASPPDGRAIDRSEPRRSPAASRRLLRCCVARLPGGRSGRPIFERIPRVALTGLLAVAAAPWVHTYDMIPLSVAVVVLAPTTRADPYWPYLALPGSWPGAVVLLPVPLPFSVASIAAVAWLVWREGSTRRKRNLGRFSVHSRARRKAYWIAGRAGRWLAATSAAWADY